MRNFLVATAFLGLPLMAAAADRLNVKTGLWEITSVTHISGMPPLPAELLAKMTPKQRADMEAAFRAENAKGPQTDVDRECITEADLEKPFQSADSEDCKQTIVQSSRTSQEVRLVCTGEHNGSGTFRINTPTPESMAGVLDLKAGDGANSMTIKSQVKGRWLGPDCGDEDDASDVQAEEEEDDAGA
jgi:Protein of unknown function (DUF3617)